MDHVGALKAFAAVVDCGSFVAASRHLDPAELTGHDCLVATSWVLPTSSWLHPTSRRSGAMAAWRPSWHLRPPWGPSRQPVRAPMVRVLAFIDWQGWTGATFVLGMAMVWMIPSTLDAALLSAPIAAIKLASWWLAGAVLAGSWRRWSPELLLFTAGNLRWMMATAGALYIDAPLRLCASYLQGEQRHTGIALIAAALAIGVLATVRAATSRAITSPSGVSSATPTSLLLPSAHAARQPAGGSDRRHACVAPHPES